MCAAMRSGAMSCAESETAINKMNGINRRMATKCTARLRRAESRWEGGPPRYDNSAPSPINFILCAKRRISGGADAIVAIVAAPPMILRFAQDELRQESARRKAPLQATLLAEA